MTLLEIPPFDTSFLDSFGPVTPMLSDMMLPSQTSASTSNGNMSGSAQDILEYFLSDSEFSAASPAAAGPSSLALTSPEPAMAAGAVTVGEHNPFVTAVNSLKVRSDDAPAAAQPLRQSLRKRTVKKHADDYTDMDDSDSEWRSADDSAVIPPVTRSRRSHPTPAARASATTTTTTTTTTTAAAAQVKSEFGVKSEPNAAALVMRTRNGRPTAAALAATVDSADTLDKSVRNALAARENRERKKRMLSDFGNQVNELEAENGNLRDLLQARDEKCSALLTEVEYLRRVIANQSMLSSVLATVGKAPGVTFAESRHSTTRNLVNAVASTSSASSSASAKLEPGTQKRGLKRSASDNLENEVAKKHNIDSQVPDSGVCIHVSERGVSVEFCAHCCTPAAL